MRQILNWFQESGIVVVAVASGVAAGFLIGAAVHAHRFGGAGLPVYLQQRVPASCIRLEYTEPRARAALLHRAAPAAQQSEEREPW